MTKLKVILDINDWIWFQYQLDWISRQEGLQHRFTTDIEAGSSLDGVTDQGGIFKE